MARNRPQRNNNPVNLRFAKQKEAIGQDLNGFAIFPTPEAGWRAAHAQIRLDASRGLALKSFINKFAPPSENDTGLYVKLVAELLKMSIDTSLDSISPYTLAGAMAQIEGYYATSFTE